MLKLNQTVLYGTTGVCTVVSIEEKKIGREKRNYYVLKPNSAATSTVYVPADNDLLLSKARELVSKENIAELFEELPKANSVWIDSDSERRKSFSDIVMSGDRKGCLSLLKTLIVKQKQLSAAGKRLHLADERVLREVQRLICDEFSYVLGIPTDEVLAKIQSLI